MVALTGLCLALMACLPIRPAPTQLGVRLSSTEPGLEIRYVTCPGEVIERVTVLAPEGMVVNDGDDEIIWRIRSRHGTRVDMIQVGSVPPGFREELAIRGPDRLRGNLSVMVDSSSTQAAATLPTTELVPDAFWTQTGVRAEQDFESLASERCAADGGSGA